MNNRDRQIKKERKREKREGDEERERENAAVIKMSTRMYFHFYKFIW